MVQPIHRSSALFLNPPVQPAYSTSSPSLTKDDVGDEESEDEDEEAEQTKETPKTLSRAIKPPKALISIPPTTALRSLDNSLLAAISYKWSGTCNHAVVIE
jgi:hypothetical protein